MARKKSPPNAKGASLVLPPSATADKNKVYVAIATFCEKILLETGYLTSAIRAIDAVMIPAAALPPSGGELFLPISMLMLFRSEDTRDRQLKIRLRSPTLKLYDGGSWKINFPGPGLSNHVFHTGLTKLMWDGEGQYWIEAEMDGTVVAWIPLSVKIAPAETLAAVPVPPDAKGSPDTKKANNTKKAR